MNRFIKQLNTAKNRQRILVALALFAVTGYILYEIIMPYIQAQAVSPSDISRTKIAVTDPENDVPRITIKPVVDRYELPAARRIPQTFNNCGPATTSMVLQYFGHNVDQNTTKAALRTGGDDKNVTNTEISNYLRGTYGIESRVMVNGDIETLKLLITNDVYVVAEDWLHPNEDIGHVTIIRGYDNSAGVLIADDSYLRQVPAKYPYGEFDEAQWKAFNRSYLPVYRPDQEEVVKAILGENWDRTKMYENAITRNRAAVTANANDMHAWFNLGTSYYALGQYGEARDAFARAEALGWPKRMLWYQLQPIETYNTIGDHNKAVKLAKIALVGNDAFPEAHLEAARSYKGLGNLSMARFHADRALQYAPSYQPAREFRATI